MNKNLPIHLQEIIFGSSDSAISQQISKLEKAGEIRKIAPRIYTSNLEEEPAAIMRRNLFVILGGLYDGAVLSHRSAIEFEPTESEQIFVTYKYTKKIKLPGLTIRFLEGKGAIDGDNLLSAGLYAAQKERAVLENLQVSRKSGPDSKTLPKSVIEEKLETIIRVHGETGLNKFRDKAREIAQELGMEREFEKLQKMIGALLSTRSKKSLSSPLAIARALGLPYDPDRIGLFEGLFKELEQQEFPFYKDLNLEADNIEGFRNFAFFESYFSNYIEGTVFEVVDAQQIIKTQKPMPARNADSHDILGTYRIVSNKKEMSRRPTSGDELIEILQYRHQILLSARPSKNPGLFKDKNNFAGQTSFVDFNLVRGTLIKGFDLYNALSHPFGKAIYMMFLISEVHPFLDGNGRIARVMMNAELTGAGLAKIIIPTVYREDYLLALRRLTRSGDSTAYVKMLQRAYEFSKELFYLKMEDFENHLMQCNAFLDSADGRLVFLRNLS